METKTYTEQELFEIGYIYLGVLGGETKSQLPNQLWRFRDELIIWNPEDGTIVFREYNEPRYQCNYFNEPTTDLHVGEREHK